MAMTVATICFSLLFSFVILLNVAESYKSGRRSNITIETVHGDIYDCIDIYQQPTLLHPKVDGERVKMIIAKELERQRLKAMQPTKEDESNFNVEEYWLNKKACPLGTVPIRRMTKKQLQRSKYASLSLAHEYFGYNFIDFAGITIKASPPIDRFIGVSAFLSLYNPQVNGIGQYSASTMLLENTEGPDIEVLQVGWIVYPSLNGDTRTRLYTSWTVDSYQKTGCYNTLCPGFIQISHLIPIDYAFPRTSDLQSSDKEEVLLCVTQNDNFDYQLGMPIIDDQMIGMWPSEMFNKLSKNADLVGYGGNVYTPAGEYISPPMGSGKFSGGHWQLTCYMRKIFYEMESDGRIIGKAPDDSEVEPHDSRCFYEQNYKDNDDYWDYTLLFGGHGGGDQSEFCQY